MTIRRRSHLALALLAVLALVAAACGGGDDGAAGGGSGDEVACPVDALDGAPGPVTVTVWNNYTALAKRTFESMVADFNASQERVRVQAEPQGIAFEEIWRKYRLASEDGKLPNLVLLEDTTTQQISDSGTIIPGGACFDADADSQAILDDFLPIAPASYTVDGVLQPVGFDVYTALVFYNKDHFRAAGLDPEQPPATLEEIRTAAEAIKQADVSPNPVAVLGTAWQPEWWLTGVGQTLVNEDNGREALATEGTFDNPNTRGLFDFWRGMVADGLAGPVPGTEGQANHLFAMATGSSSIVVESSAGVNTIAGLLEGTVDPEVVQEDLGVSLPPGSRFDLDLGVGAFPGIEEPGQGQIGGGAWYMTNAGTPEQQAATWEFMKWFNATPQQVRWTLAGSGLPVVRSAVDDPQVQEKWTSTLGGRWSAVAFEVLENVRTDFPGPLIGPYKETRDAIRVAYEQVLLGDGNVDAAVRGAQAKIDAAVQQYRESVGG
jgi:sn-glycerol 3-phosphate transport system substrate-binding protein